MAKQTKAKTVNLYNIDLQEDKKEKTKRKPLAKNKTKKTSTTDKFNFDNEIIIGVKPIKENKKPPVKTKKIDKKKKVEKDKKEKPLKSKTNKIQNVKKLNTNIKKKTNSKKKNVKKSVIEEDNKKRGKGFQIVKWTILIICLIGSIIFVMMSPAFNIAEIQVIGNSKLTVEKVVSLSQIEIGQNIFQINKIQSFKEIKQNSYVEDVNIRRKLPNILEIEVQERVPTYMLEYGESYVYVNNQGYILEISSNSKPVPIIIGQKTSQEEMFEGNRLCVEDLEKLEVVIKIVETAANNDIAYLITKVDISNKQNYTLTLEDEQKVVYLGNGSDINTRILYLKKILDLTSGKPGELFMNGDLNTKDVYFREKITE